MKKITTILLLAAVITSSMNCKKSDAIPLTSKQLSENKIQSVVQARDFSSRGQMYSLLTSDEKYNMWLSHLQMAKEQFADSGEVDKLLLIQRLLEAMSPAVFEENSPEQDVFLNYFIPLWDKDAKRVFTDEEEYEITFVPDATVISKIAPIDIGDTPGGDGTPPCFCNVGTSGFTCRKWIISIPPSVQNGICEKTSADCLEKRKNCGWFWQYTCDGNHCQF